MKSTVFTIIAIWPALVYCLPAPDPRIPGYNDADAPYASEEPSENQPIPTEFGGQNSQVPYTEVSAATPYPRVSDDLSGPTSHGPYSSTPTVTGAVEAPTTLAESIAPLPPNPTATYYNKDGTLLNPAPAPYTPDGKSVSLTAQINTKIT